MKLMLLVFLAAALQFSNAAHADDTVVCEILGSKTWLKIAKPSAGDASVTLYRYNSSTDKDVEIGKFVGKEISELAYSKFRLSLVASRDNDILKISSDLDFFGGSSTGHSAPNPVTWKGLIFRSPENMGAPKGPSFKGKISCSFDYSS